MIETIFYIFMFLAGAGILIYSVEELIENISKAAILTGVFSFFLAVIFAGMDFENWASWDRKKSRLSCVSPKQSTLILTPTLFF